MIAYQAAYLLGKQTTLSQLFLAYAIDLDVVVKVAADFSGIYAFIRVDLLT